MQAPRKTKRDFWGENVQSRARIGNGPRLLFCGPRDQERSCGVLIGALAADGGRTLAYDDLAARERNWRTFVNDPEWLKLRATEGYSDAEIVSNISNVMFSPLPFSQIK